MNLSIYQIPNGEIASDHKCGKMGYTKHIKKMAKSVTEWLKKRTKDKWLKGRWAKIPTHFDWPIKSYWTHLWYVIDVKVVLKANTSWGVLHSHGAEESPVKSPG